MKEIAKYFLAGLILLVLADAFTGGAVLARYQAWRAAAASGGGDVGARIDVERPAEIRFVEPDVIYTGVEMRLETAVSPTSPPPPATATALPTAVPGMTKYEEALGRVDDWASTRPVRP